LHRDEPLGAEVLGFLNRLSDLLFVMARIENARAKLPDVEWVGRDR
jgi:cob(I)alamin adenosyltransferase